jgi:hypothetical protein
MVATDSVDTADMDSPDTVDMATVDMAAMVDAVLAPVADTDMDTVTDPEGKDMIARFAATTAVVLAVLISGRPAWSAQIAWRSDLTAAAQESAASGKPLLVMVKARWCGPCHKMLQQSFPDPALTARINAGFIPVLIDADQQTALIQKLNINAFPTMLILGPNLRVVERVTGFQSAAQLNSRLIALKPTGIRVAKRPVQVALAPPPIPSPPVPRMQSFHDRIWASIRASPVQDLSPALAFNVAPGPDRKPDAAITRDTLAAALEFSAGR